MRWWGSCGPLRPSGLDDRACAELAILVGDLRLRDLVWAMIEPETADEHVALWQRVVSRVTPTVSAGPLALLGMAGWISGDGALLNRPGCGRAWVARSTPTSGGSSRVWPGEVACR